LKASPTPSKKTANGHQAFKKLKKTLKASQGHSPSNQRRSDWPITPIEIDSDPETVSGLDSISGGEGQTNEEEIPTVSIAEEAQKCADDMVKEISSVLPTSPVEVKGSA
jgi:hypothetical protein